jgi:hypothetical protein
MFLSNHFSGGSDGTTITTGNSGGISGDAWTSVAGVPAFEADNATGHRAPLVCLWASSSDRLRWGGVTFSGRQLWVRQYLYFTANPSGGSEQPLNINNEGGGFTNAFVYINTTGHFHVADTNNVTHSDTTSTINLNAWIRYEFFVNIGTTTSNGSYELRMYNDPDSFTPTETMSGSGLNFNTTLPDRISWVRNQGTNFYSDSHAVTDTGWIGPDPYGNPTTPKVSTAGLVRASTW